MIKMDFDIDTSDLDAWELLRIPEQKTVLRQGAAKYLAMQAKRVNSGKDVDGNTFRPYTPEYGARKAKAGRVGKGQFLRLTGQMMRSQHVTVYREADAWVAKIAFEGSQTPSKIAVGGGGRHVVTQGGGDMIPSALLAAVNDFWRPFVGMNERETEKVFNSMADRIIQFL